MADVVLGPTIEPVEPMAPGVEAQNALHWLVRMSSSFGAGAAARDGFGLRWHADRRIVLTPELMDGVRLELQVARLSFQFHERGAPSPHVLVLDDKSTAEIEAWLLVEMLHRGFDRERFSKVLPYDAKALMSGDEPKYEAEEHRAELEAIAERLARADQLLRQARRELDAAGGTDDALTVWPDGFSIGFLTGTSDGNALRPVVRLAYVLDADGSGHPAYVADRYSDQGPMAACRQTLEEGDGIASAANLVALVRNVEVMSQQ